MLPRVTAPVLDVLETYYDTAPRASATTEEVGPFTLFLRADEDGYPYYARPRLGLADDVTADDVRRTRERQRALEAPETFEWVHQTTPSLLPAAREAGLEVAECPLLVLGPAGASAAEPADGSHRVVRVSPDQDDLALVLGTVSAGFRGTDEVATATATALARRRRLMDAGLVAMVVAYDEDGEPVGGGAHGPRGATTELAGIAVLPRARRRGVGEAVTRALVADARDRGVETVFLSAQDDAVARVYERVGFERVGTACIGEAR
jgi:ribosomal protein S18 acetylase RimI-like enzyme